MTDNDIFLVDLIINEGDIHKKMNMGRLFYLVNLLRG